jgi:hypothetical protein
LTILVLLCQPLGWFDCRFIFPITLRSWLRVSGFGLRVRGRVHYLNHTQREEIEACPRPDLRTMLVLPYQLLAFLYVNFGYYCVNFWHRLIVEASTRPERARLLLSRKLDPPPAQHVRPQHALQGRARHCCERSRFSQLPELVNSTPAQHVRPQHVLQGRAGHRCEQSRFFSQLPELVNFLN